MGRRLTIVLGLMAAFLRFSPVEARVFESGYLSFELPTGWDCELEDDVWTCQGSDPVHRRETIIVLTAKVRGPDDDVNSYLGYLQQPKRWTDLSRKSVVSRVVFARIVQINGQPWVDALHENSELVGFLTRYGATIQADIGVLMTFSIRKDVYERYVQDVERLRATLRVTRRQGQRLSR
jgi:hypothetical protein